MAKPSKPNGYHNSSLVERASAFRKQKSLGQCFLVSSLVLDDICSFTLSPAEQPDLDGDLVLEIGSGIGFLTERLAPLCRKLYAVELDAKCLVHLNLIAIQHPHLKIHRRDILQTQLRDLVEPDLLAKILGGQEEKLKIIANIPYQISSRIITHFLGEIGEDLEPSSGQPSNRALISEINILVQKEFAARLCAKPGTKDHGSLTLLVNYWAEVEKLFDVKRTMFLPQPQVDSTLVSIRLRPKPLLDFSTSDIPQPALKLRQLIKAIYANRRKTMNNVLKSMGLGAEIIRKLDLANLRGETMDLEALWALLLRIEALKSVE